MNLLFLVLFTLASGISMKESEAAKAKPCEPISNPDCFCIQLFDPVCGCDGVTYGNACIAGCNNITKFKKGECKDKKK